MSALGLLNPARVHVGASAEAKDVDTTADLGMGIGTSLSGTHMHYLMTKAHISSSADALRNRIYNISFNNTVELHSNIYFCRIAHNEFNYSANPTYLSDSQIRVKQNATDTPVAYITSVGLYDGSGVLMAVGKLSEPLRKDPTIEYTLRARLDY